MVQVTTNQYLGQSLDYVVLNGKRRDAGRETHVWRLLLLLAESESGRTRTPRVGASLSRVDC